MKKFIKLFCLIVVLIGLVSLTTACNDDEDEYLIEISYDEFQEKLDNGETFILEIMQTGCSHCASFTPKFKTVLEEYEITAYQLNVSDITEEQLDDMNSKYGSTSGDGSDKSLGTPTVIFFVDGEATSKTKWMVGEQTKAKIISKLKTNGYINESDTEDETKEDE